MQRFNFYNFKSLVYFLKKEYILCYTRKSLKFYIHMYIDTYYMHVFAIKIYFYKCNIYDIEMSMQFCQGKEFTILNTD